MSNHHIYSTIENNLNINTSKIIFLQLKKINTNWKKCYYCEYKLYAILYRRQGIEITTVSTILSYLYLKLCYEEQHPVKR